ncbi:DNA-binding transcriptional regulator, LacI/PurR family [Limimaricola pyoseonensis]|uniref:DNA-binding transcriptional regulator, LacI/PurR family n=2 Tax=Limimaricola pyoseonensis TaxID=521013 RepID=A0A1G7FRF8_9RHOB|nr:DNA-binding transcriptional regulator, LacI/PurR family [Limimaricola pyoseonensis]
MVAEAAGVSRVAVSRAFNPEASLDAEKRARILEIARRMNYAPDRAARALKMRRSHLVGVIVPDVCSPWESQEIDALTTALQERGLGTLLFKTRADLTLADATLRNLRSFNLDSVIAFAESVGPDRLRPYLDRAVPIYVDYLGAGTPATALADVDRLEIDLVPGMTQAVALLAGHGARRVAYLSGRPGSQAERSRRATLEALLSARGLPPPRVAAGDFTYATARQATLDLFRLDGGADAIFAANDESAFGAMDALRHGLGLAVPGDVHVVGFDDIAQSGWDSYALTTVKIDLAARVQALVRLILRRTGQPEAPPLREALPTSLVVRNTVGGGAP